VSTGWDELVEEARGLLPPKLDGMLRIAKEKVIVAVRERDYIEFSLEWHPTCNDQENDLTHAQARAIWKKWGGTGSSISLTYSPGDSPGIWKLHCDSFERKVFNEELMEVLTT
jgi:hypothetical protein